MKGAKVFGVFAVGLVLCATVGFGPAQAERPGDPGSKRGPAAGERGPGPSIEREMLRPGKEAGRGEPRRAGPPGKGTPGGPPGKPSRETLRYGSAQEAGLLPEYVAEIGPDAESGITDGAYPGAVVLAGRNGVIAEHEAYGNAVEYADDETRLPEDERVPMEDDTIFDLASVSKLFTSIAAMQLVERGELELDAPVADYIPEFAANGKQEVTVRQLLTHTSGLPPFLPLYSDYDTVEERLDAVYTAEQDAPEGTLYQYSDLNMIALGKIVEKQSGAPLDEVVEENITAPLGMTDTGYNPPQSKTPRIAATEYQPYLDRGMVRGSVHDENAWSLGGVAGHAGVFGTARDLAVLAQTILNEGSYGGERILDPGSVEQLVTNYNQDFPGNDHGLGFELYQRWYMDAMATPYTAGHTGFTGTSMVLNPQDDTFAILLTNRVHPTRDTVSTNPYRQAVARDVARAVPVRVPGPPGRAEAWFSGIGDDLDNTLDLPLDLPSGEKDLRFDLWYDTEPSYDFGRVEVSTDGGESWEPVEGTVTGKDGFRESVSGGFDGYSGRQWLKADFDLGPYSGPVVLRFGYASDASSSGRGVYVNDVKVKGQGRPVFDDKRPQDRGLWRADGWELSRD